MSIGSRWRNCPASDLLTSLFAVSFAQKFFFTTTKFEPERRKFSVARTYIHDYVIEGFR